MWNLKKGKKKKAENTERGFFPQIQTPSLCIFTLQQAY